jgi:hypothetical protein
MALANAVHGEGDLSQARTRYSEGLGRWGRLPAWSGRRRHCGALGVPVAPSEDEAQVRLITAVSDAVGETEVARAEAAGQMLLLKQAIAEALTLCEGCA